MPIIGGVLSGLYLNGRILSGGGDWQIIRNDGVVDLRAQYALELTDGTLVEVDNRCLRHLPAEAENRMAVGDAVSPADYDFQIFSDKCTSERGRW